jgi:hypothetical protein
LDPPYDFIDGITGENRIPPRSPDDDIKQIRVTGDELVGHYAFDIELYFPPSTGKEYAWVFKDLNGREPPPSAEYIEGIGGNHGFYIDAEGNVKFKYINQDSTQWITTDEKFWPNEATINEYGSTFTIDDFIWRLTPGSTLGAFIFGDGVIDEVGIHNEEPILQVPQSAKPGTTPATTLDPLFSWLGEVDIPPADVERLNSFIQIDPPDDQFHIMGEESTEQPPEIEITRAAAVRLNMEGPDSLAVDCDQENTFCPDHGADYQPEFLDSPVAFAVELAGDPDMYSGAFTRIIYGLLFTVDGEEVFLAPEPHNPYHGTTHWRELPLDSTTGEYFPLHDSNLVAGKTKWYDPNYIIKKTNFMSDDEGASNTITVFTFLLPQDQLANVTDVHITAWGFNGDGGPEEYSADEIILKKDTSGKPTIPEVNIGGTGVSE